MIVINCFIDTLPFSGVAVSGFARTVETSRRARTGCARSAGKTSKSHTFFIVGVLIEIHTEHDLRQHCRLSICSILIEFDKY